VDIVSSSETEVSFTIDSSNGVSKNLDMIVNDLKQALSIE
jgi:hypothetical protein